MLIFFTLSSIYFFFITTTSLMKQTPLDESMNEGTLIVDGKPLNVNQWLRYKDPNFNLFRHCGAVRIDCFMSNVSETRSSVWILERHMLQASLYVYFNRVCNASIFFVEYLTW